MQSKHPVGFSDGLPRGVGKLSGNPTACHVVLGNFREIRRGATGCWEAFGKSDGLPRGVGSLSGNPTGEILAAYLALVDVFYQQEKDASLRKLRSA